mgnify:CR=1 FL=1
MRLGITERIPRAILGAVGAHSPGVQSKVSGADGESDKLLPVMRRRLPKKDLPEP